MLRHFVAVGGSTAALVLGGLTAALAVGPCCSSAWAQRPFSGSLVPPRSALERVGLERHWSSVVPMELSEKTVQLSFTENQVFAQTSRGRFHAFDAETGGLQWSVTLGPVTSFSRPASVNSTLVFVGNESNIIALDRKTGRPAFSYTLAAPLSITPVADDNRLIVGEIDGLIATYDLFLDLEERYVMTKPDGEAVLRPPLRNVWNLRTGNSLQSRPILTKHVVAVGGQDGKLVVVANRTGAPQILYRFATGGPILGALGALGTRTLLVPSTDNNLYALDLFNGDLIWSFAAEAPISQGPLVTERGVYFQDDAGVVTSLDIDKFWYVETPEGQVMAVFPMDQLRQAERRASALIRQTGQTFTVLSRPKWKSDKVEGELLTLSQTRVYGRDRNGSLFILNREDGSVLRTPSEILRSVGLDLRPFKEAVINSENDRIYLATPTGLVICLREITNLQPRPLRAAADKPFGFIEGVDDKVIEDFGQPDADAGLDNDFGSTFEFEGIRR